jgi:hypothetical protein
MKARAMPPLAWAGRPISRRTRGGCVGLDSRYRALYHPPDDRAIITLGPGLCRSRYAHAKAALLSWTSSVPLPQPFGASCGPLINVTADTSVQPSSILVNGNAWFYVSGPTNVGSGYFKTAYDYTANSYNSSVGHNVSVGVTWTSGPCAGTHWGTIAVVA